MICDDEQLNYRELNNRANQLAQHLASQGVGADVRVGVCIDRSVAMLIAVLATLKAGGAYVPLDPEYPKERMRFMLKESQCQVLLTNERLLGTLPKIESNVLCLDLDWHKVANESVDNPSREIDGDNLGYVIYTSGSTGRPKGVAMTAGALANLIAWQLEHAGPFPAAKTLQFASLSFDVSFQEIFSTLCAGGTLVLISEELRRDIFSLTRFLASQKVARIFVPVIFLQHLAETVNSGAAVPEHLREIIVAGEQLEITPQIEKLFGKLKDCRLLNHYGPSETHVATAYSLPRVLSDWPALPPIGRPIANTQIYILDGNLEPTPIGVPGQLCIGGVSLSRGYLRESASTAENFLPDPFGKNPGARLYLTGDLARYRRDGNIEFLGRADNQVKIRGFRVELGEIESMLTGHPSVREAVVVAREDVKGDRKLVGYIVPVSGAAHNLSPELRLYLKERLPDHMVPAVYMILEELPFTPSGKVNRRALPPPDTNLGTDNQLDVAPRTKIEEQLVEIWVTVLRLERIGVNDNFFELGGHSLLATQLISRVRNTFKLELPLRYLFASPTVAELASVIVQFKTAMTSRPAPAILKHSGDEARELLTRIDQLSEEEVDALLSQEMGEGDSE